MTQAGQLLPNLFTAKLIVASPISPAPTKTTSSFMAFYPLMRTSGLFLRRIEAGVTSTSSSSLI